MLFRTYVKEDEAIVELSDEEVKNLLNYCKNYNKIIDSIFQKNDISIIESSLKDLSSLLDNNKEEEDNIEVKNLNKGDVYYINYQNEKDEEYYFRILGVYNNYFKNDYIIKTITAYFEKNKLMYIGIEYYILDSFVKDDRIVYFGKRFPKTIKTELLDFISSVKDE